MTSSAPKPPECLLTPLGLLYRLHPWHGLEVDTGTPGEMNVYIEIVPSDTMKFEMDKLSGSLRIDRPQRFSNRCPAPYGFIPQTLCGTRVAGHCMQKTGREGIVGDGDPLDICVLAESDINHGDVVLTARPIGGLRMIDRQQSDDKILAVLVGDLAYGQVQELRDLPPNLVDRLRHYFLTYKEIPGSAPPETEITDIFDRAEAMEIIGLARRDYTQAFGQLRAEHERLIGTVRKTLESGRREAQPPK